MTATSISPPDQGTIIVGMSGGVDSSVSALRLLQAGRQVEGLFMKNWEDDDHTEYCTARADLEDAQRVADQLGIRLHTANFAAEYWSQVFEIFLAEYRAHRTPNPDVLCNREIKFQVFIEYAELLGARRIATGHYAQLRRRAGQLELLRATDATKDQTYFLHTVPGTQLARCEFPLGTLTKVQVRTLARRAGFHNHNKKDSTGICFIGKRRFADFLARYLKGEPGAIESVSGEVVGEHQGLPFYTLGQRQRLGIGGHARSDSNAPWYVVDKDVDRNVLLVAQGQEHPALASDWLTVSQAHWIDRIPTLPFDCTAQIRHRQAEQPVTVSGSATGRLNVQFTTPQRAITPGQSVCFYAGKVCLGGGVIEARRRLQAVPDAP